MLTLLARTRRRVGPLFLVLIVLVATFQAALVAVAATIVDGGGFERLAGLAPAFMQQALGPALTSFAGLTSLTFFEPLIVMLVVEFAIYLGTEPAGDVESGLVDLLLARPVPRHRLVTRSLLVMTSATVVLPIAIAVSLWANLFLLAPSNAQWPEAHVVLLLMSNLAAVAWAFGALALAAASWARRRGAAQAMVGVGAVALYLMEVVGEAWPRVVWASWISPFHRFHGASILAGRTQPLYDLTILLAIGIAATGAAYWQFQRRDV